MQTRFLYLAALSSVLSLPSYAAELPQSAVLQYSGSYGIPATMTFTRTGNQYKIVSNIKVPLYHIRFESGGNIVGNFSAHDRNTKLNLANAYQIKNEAID